MKDKKLITLITTMMLVITVFAIPSVSFADEIFKTDSADITDTTRIKTLKVKKTVRLSAPVVRAKAISCGIKLKWKKVENAKGYIVYRYKSGKFRKVKILKKTGWINKKLACRKTYAFKVRAYYIKKGKKVKSPSSRTVFAKTVARKYYYNNVTANSIINTAKTKLGCAYVYGSSGPSSFDCSGLVYWTLKHSRKNKVRPARGSATSMYYSKLKKYSVGKKKKNLKRGDIIMFSNNGSDARMCHTGIYYGGNRVLHASTPATGVCISSLAWQAPIAAIIRLP